MTGNLAAVKSALEPGTIPASFPLGRAWYVVATFSGMETSIERELIGLGFDSYTPRGRRKRMISRRKVVRDYPLFVGYVFVAFDIEREEWSGPILDIDGVIDILSNNQIPIRVASDVIDRIRRAEMAGKFDYTKPSAAFSVGDSVEIKEGPMAGLIARIKSASAKKRVQIILEFLGGPQIIKIDAGLLQKAG